MVYGIAEKYQQTKTDMGLLDSHGSLPIVRLNETGMMEGTVAVPRAVPAQFITDDVERFLQGIICEPSEGPASQAVDWVP